MLKHGNRVVMEGHSLRTFRSISLKSNLSSAEADIGGETDHFRPFTTETSLTYCGVPHPQPGSARSLILLSYLAQKTSPTTEDDLQ